MNFHQQAADWLVGTELVQAWPEMRTIILQVAGRGPRVWDLPCQAAAAVGAPLRLVWPAVGAVACAQISITILDDLLDEDAVGLHHRLGAGVAANLAAGFQALGGLLLEQAPPEMLADLQAAYARLLGWTACGQHEDALTPDTEEGYWQMVAHKSATFYGQSFYLGARLAGAGPNLAAGLRDVWGLYGEIIQIHDDMKDSLASPAEPDWLLGRLPLPILFASQVAHPAQARFESLRRRAEDPQALEEAQRILLRCGAISYCLDQLLARQRRALAGLVALPLARPEGLQKMLADTVEPVAELLRLTGVGEQEVAAVLAG